jgi:cell division protein FtsI (penicillin-binding protein 3)
MMKLEGALFPWRFRLVVGCSVVMVVLAICWRIIDLQVVDRDFLKGQGDARSLRTYSDSCSPWSDHRP